MYKVLNIGKNGHILTGFGIYDNMTDKEKLEIQNRSKTQMADFEKCVNMLCFPSLFAHMSPKPYCALCLAGHAISECVQN